jgi:hypothetical protein
VDVLVIGRQDVLCNFRGGGWPTGRPFPRDALRYYMYKFFVGGKKNWVPAAGERRHCCFY